MSKRFYILFAIITVIVGCGYLATPLFIMGLIMMAALVIAAVIDFIKLRRGMVKAVRECQPRWSNGDNNEVEICVKSTFSEPVSIEVIDEIPPEFQIRDFSRRMRLAAGGSQSLSYQICPKERGEYHFGNVIAIVSTNIGLALRRFVCGKQTTARVYPAFFALKSYELATIRTNNIEAGVKRIRRIGNATEFSQIKDYVPDDDYRRINWKASARRHQLMVNVYEEEKAQHVYNIIDKGRVMQQTFNHMTLLDHSVNAALALSHIAMKKDDNVGLMTFDNKSGTFLPSTHNRSQMNRILETLYNIKTDFLESDFSELNSFINKNINKRSLIILYTNFFSIDALKRQLAFLKSISQRHRLLVVLFEDSEQNEFIKTNPHTEEEFFQHVIAEKYAFDKTLILNILQRNGILALLTEPKNLSINVINKYIDIKARNMF